jgi:hypothetical protein
MKLKFWKKGKNDVQLDTIQLNKSSKYPLAVQKIHNEFMNLKMN